MFKYCIAILFLLITCTAQAGEWVLSWDGGKVAKAAWNNTTDEQRHQVGEYLSKEYFKSQGTEDCKNVKITAEVEGDYVHFWGECTEWGGGV
jgi:hypothetical protein